MAASAAATPQPVASSVINKTVVPAPVPVRSAPTVPTPVPVPVKVQAPAKPEVVALKKRPAPQWEQHTPGANDEMQVDPANKTPPPDWYKAGAVSDLEQTLLPEWFDGSAPHRTNKSYLSARETMIKMSDTLGNRYITSTMARRCIPGDAGSLLRLHSFLSSYALINDDAMNDSAPTPMVLQKLPEQKGAAAWNETLRDDLMEAVVEQSSKRPKLDPSNDSSGFVPLNWNAVAAKVGHGATPDGCEREFLGLPLNGDGNNAPREGSITPDGEPRTNGNKEASKLTKLEVQQEIFQELVTKSDPAVIRAVTEASLQATGKLADAQKTAIYGLVASQAEQEASTHEDSVARVLSEIVDLRMKKLENRMSLMDDIEGMLEAERIALELERRDLYTARCRHWFGGP
jgi:SWI/SNF related-matrix-associated actin-dependent regulator of chromatin subfamily C